MNSSLISGLYYIRVLISELYINTQALIWDQRKISLISVFVIFGFLTSGSHCNLAHEQDILNLEFVFVVITIVYFSVLGIKMLENNQ